MYKLLNKDALAQYECVTRLSDGACIPFAEDNTDYQEFLKWCAEGNEPLPPDALPVDEPPDEATE